MGSVLKTPDRAPKRPVAPVGAPIAPPDDFAVLTEIFIANTMALLSRIDLLMPASPRHPSHEERMANVRSRIEDLDALLVRAAQRGSRRLGPRGNGIDGIEGLDGGRDRD